MVSKYTLSVFLGFTNNLDYCSEKLSYYHTYLSNTNKILKNL